MRSVTTRFGVLLALLATFGCGPGEAPEGPPPPAPVAKLTCPVCAGTFAADRTVMAGDPAGDVPVCSNGCVIRYAIAKHPPVTDSRPAGPAESQPDEDE